MTHWRVLCPHNLLLKTTTTTGDIQQDSAQAHRVHETVSFLACNLAIFWLVLNFVEHTQWIYSKFSLKMPQHIKYLATVIYDLPLITIPVSNCHLFSDITISQGSVATRLRCGEILAVTLL